MIDIQSRGELSLLNGLESFT